MSKGANRNIT